MNTGPTARLFYTYDDLGKLTGKTYGQTLTPVTESLTYYIQGWRTGQQVKKGSDYLFSTSIRYYDSYLGSEPSYTGNISSWTWGYDNQLAASYVFEYDKLARLTDTDHYIDAIAANEHVEKSLSYDKNGNLLSVMRFTGGALADDLTMSYNGNQISGITEGVPALHSAISDGICSYDANGNLVSNNYEGFAFQYNLLNLPQRITKTDKSGTMLATYSYYCDGTKYSVTDATGNSRIYAGNLVYVKRNGVVGLESAAFGGGRFRTSLVIGGVAYIPDYFITDHLGSTRAIIESGETVAQYNYYPYGGEWSTSSQLVSDDNRYKFSGKEDQTTLGAPIYDFHARSYTSRVPMFLQQDPKATDYYSLSPYAYCAGNPIRYMDTTGEKIVDAQGRVLYENGKWTPAAENTDAMRIGNAMMITPTGTKVWNDMAESNTVINLSVSREVKRPSYKTLRSGAAATHIENGEKNVSIIIYEGSINEVAKSGKIRDKEKLVLMQAATSEERIGAVATHEGTHALDDKRDSKREKRAETKEKKYLQEALEQKPIGNEWLRDQFLNLPL